MSDDTPMRRFDWEIRREIRPGTYRTYAHGYWRDPFVVVVWGRVLIGKRALRRKWAEFAAVRAGGHDGR